MTWCNNPQKNHVSDPFLANSSRKPVYGLEFQTSVKLGHAKTMERHKPWFDVDLVELFTQAPLIAQDTLKKQLIVKDNMIRALENSKKAEIAKLRAELEEKNKRIQELEAEKESLSRQGSQDSEVGDWKSVLDLMGKQFGAKSKEAELQKKLEKKDERIRELEEIVKANIAQGEELEQLRAQLANIDIQEPQKRRKLVKAPNLEESSGSEDSDGWSLVNPNSSED